MGRAAESIMVEDQSAQDSSVSLLLQVTDPEVVTELLRHADGPAPTSRPVTARTFSGAASAPGAPCPRTSRPNRPRCASSESRTTAGSSPSSAECASSPCAAHACTTFPQFDLLTQLKRHRPQGTPLPALSAHKYAEVQAEGVHREARLGDVAPGHETSGENPSASFVAAGQGGFLPAKMGEQR